jgi:DNA-binding response OmpR family regulator
MPQTDGFEFCTWIRSQKGLAGVRLVILSSSDLERDVKRARALGADEYLVKLPTVEAMTKLLTQLGIRRK